MKALYLFVLLPLLALAAELPQAGPEDPRIRTVVYDPSQVVLIKGHYGFEQMVQLADDEKIESLAIGDSLAWQAAPNKQGNLLFLKPVEPKAHTNVAVVTNKRTYAFELVAVNLLATIDDMNYVVKFRYPQDEEARVQAQLAAAAQQKQQEVVPDKKVDPSAWNLDYTMQGKGGLAPLHVFDDGQFTYFQFRERQDVPAIFLVADGKNESLLNYHVSGKYVVVERTGRQFTLRSREGEVCVYNEALWHQALVNTAAAQTAGGSGE
ncbi:P-type conjugative transfer protein VirB9 [Nevskia soli]|uniref:P-type conjugative transfer protein VirB9 n=1 Tax=Nevskia soli TaxID=418856 RepID=UPI00068F9984|nr:P-type conjugative transfer protein VirB9 [Nevskia soli]